jgi:molybdate transport system regulatory protein
LSLDAVAVRGSLIPHVKVWVDLDGQVALSDWRIELLEAVEARGSLAAAARDMGIPYRTAWYKLHEMADALGGDLLVSHSGGATRGGMVLTDRARDAIRRYRRLTDGLAELVAERFASEFADF